LIERLDKLVEAMIGLLEHYNPVVAGQMKEEFNEIKEGRPQTDMDSKVPWSESEDSGDEVPGSQINDL
jgi:hypothetical protein